jgi:hypothetical protein
MTDVLYRLKASRLGAWEMWPPELTLTETAVVRKDFLGSSGLREETLTVPLDQIASIDLNRGWVFATLRLETVGGKVIETRGLPQKEARILAKMIRGVRTDRATAWRQELRGKAD